MLALVIVCKWWMLWLLVTIGSGIWAGSKTETGGYIPDFITPLIWLILNLFMWLIYFIVI